MIDMPIMPDEHCFEAGLVGLFLKEAVNVFNNATVGQAEPYGKTLTEELYTRREKRIKLASEYLFDALKDCSSCNADNPPEVCPSQKMLDFIRERML